MFNQDCIYRQLPRNRELLPRKIVKLASEIFARQTGLSGAEIFDFFGRYSDEVSEMRYGPGAPSRWRMFEAFLESLSMEQQREALLELCDDYPYRNPPPSEEVAKLKALIGGAPVPAAIGRAVEKIDAVFVTKQWEKLSERLHDDPDGAITSARTLVESVCLYVLDQLKISADCRGDLPQLYKVTAKALGLSPQKNEQEGVRQILGSCSGLVQGISTLRNEAGDAHGRLGHEAHRRLAHLAANAAGTICTFLIEALEAQKGTRRTE